MTSRGYVRCASCLQPIEAHYQLFDHLDCQPPRAQDPATEAAQVREAEQQRYHIERQADRGARSFVKRYRRRWIPAPKLGR